MSLVFKEPKYVPAKWLIFLAGSVSAVVLGVVSLTIAYTELKSQVLAGQQAIIRINDYIRYRGDKRDVEIDKFSQKLDGIISDVGDIKEDVGLIKGRLRIK